jgi:hypothetical protein
LAYFHFVCNGQFPLTLNWRERSSPVDTVGDEEAEYLRSLTDEIDRKSLCSPLAIIIGIDANRLGATGTDLECLKSKSMYETELYWCHQLFLPHWQANQQNDQNMDELREDDFILHWTTTS